MNNSIEIKPIHTKEYNVKQSKFNQIGKLPTRSLILGPSGTCKIVLLQPKLRKSTPRKWQSSSHVW